jgi:putative PEP-CTERM system TPR-repeat lipoprotein
MSTNKPIKDQSTKDRQLTKHRIARRLSLRRLSMSCAAAVLAIGMAGGPIGLAEAALNKNSVRAYDKAQNYLKKGDHKEAVIELKNAIRSDANNVEARFQLASIYLAIGNPASAEKELKAAGARGYERAAIIPLLAQAYIVQGKYQELLEEFQDEKLTGDPKATLFTYRAQAYINLKQFDQAQEALDQARQASRDMPQIDMVSSWLRQAEGDLAGAEALIDKALKALPDNLEALIQKAELRRQAGDQKGAVKFSSKALEINQFRRAPRVTRGLAHAALSQVDEALADAEVLIERNGRDPLGAFLKAWGYAQKGEVKEALGAMSAGQATGLENFAPALYLGATLQLRDGSLEQARLYINRYLAMVPTNRSALTTSGAIYYQAGEYGEAKGVLERLYQADPQDVRVLTMLAYTYEKTGEQDKAATLFDEAINLTPGNEDLQLRAAQARIGSGDLEAGIASLADLMGSESGGERAATLLFLTQLRNKDYAAATVALDRLEELKGKTAEIENFRASIALAGGEHDEAEVFLKSAISKQADYQPARLNLARLFRSKNKFEDAEREFNLLLEQQRGYLPAISGLLDIARYRQDEKEILRLIDVGVRENAQSDRAHLIKVEQLLSLGYSDRALVAAREFISAMPESPAAYDVLARGQIATGDLASGIVTYRQLTGRLPKNSVAWYRLSQALIRDENHTEAMFSLERALSFDPTNESARRQRIEMEKKVHGDKRAITMARRLYLEAPEGPMQKIGLGIALAKYGEPEEGLELLVRTYERIESKVSLIALYTVYDQIGRLGDSMDVLSSWLEKHPDDHDLRLALFSRLIVAGRWQPAIAEGEILYKVDPKHFVVLNNLAWVYEKVGRVDEAIGLARAAVALAPEAAEVIDTLGWILYAHGDAKEAEAILAKAAGLVPARRDIVYHHAASLAKVGNNSAAKASLQKLLADGKAFEGRDEAAALLAELD